MVNGADRFKFVDHIAFYTADMRFLLTRSNDTAQVNFGCLKHNSVRVNRKLILLEKYRSWT